MGDIDGEGGGPEAYVGIALGGVQDFIASARRTSDLWVGSRLMSHLSSEAAKAVGGRRLLPGPTTHGRSFPNRILVAVEQGQAVAAARAATAAVNAEWQEIARAVHGGPPDALAPILATFPDVRWVAWEPPSGSASDFIEGWNVVTEAMAARKRVRVFGPHPRSGGRLCSLCGRFGASGVPSTLGPRVRRGERLCPICVVKLDVDFLGGRFAGDPTTPRTRFPSIASIAVAPFRARVLDAVASGRAPRLAEAVDAHTRAVAGIGEVLRGMGLRDPEGGKLRKWSGLDGSWCYPDTWAVETIIHEQRELPPDLDTAPLHAPCQAGRTALRTLLSALGDETGDGGRPATYLAVLVQDGDSMGPRLDNGVTTADEPEAWLGAVTTALSEAAGDQTVIVEERLGRAVYAGGDDMLALVPLVTVLDVADQCRRAFVARVEPYITGATASSAVVCFHHSFPLQEAIRRAHAALHEAKQDPDKDRLAVVVVRRGGERARTLLPWQPGSRSAAESLTGLAEEFRTGLSARLLASLEAERHGLAELAPSRAHRSEVGRLLGRHHGTNALDLVMGVEPRSGIVSTESVDAWVAPLAAARFLAAEAR